MYTQDPLSVFEIEAIRKSLSDLHNTDFKTSIGAIDGWVIVIFDDA